MNRITAQDIEEFADIARDPNMAVVLNAYQRIATKSAIYPGQGTPLGLLYVTLKLNGEAGELLSATPDNLVKELGDVCWYLGAIHNELKLPLSNVLCVPVSKFQPRVDRLSDVIIAASVIAETVGKTMRDDNLIELVYSYDHGAAVFLANDITRLSGDRREKINAQLGIIYIMINRIAYRRINSDVPAVLLKNLIKLACRTDRGTLRGSGDDR